MADYAAIVAALDAAILNWASKPVTLEESGRSVTYRSLKDLIEARRYYAQLNVASQNSKPFKLGRLRSGGTR